MKHLALALLLCSFTAAADEGPAPEGDHLEYLGFSAKYQQVAISHDVDFTPDEEIDGKRANFTFVEVYTSTGELKRTFLRKGDAALNESLRKHPESTPKSLRGFFTREVLEGAKLEAHLKDGAFKAPSPAKKSPNGQCDILEDDQDDATDESRHDAVLTVKTPTGELPLFTKRFVYGPAKLRVFWVPSKDPLLVVLFSIKDWIPGAGEVMSESLIVKATPALAACR